MFTKDAVRQSDDSRQAWHRVDLVRWVGVFRKKAIGRFGWFLVRSIEDGHAVRYLVSKLELLGN